METKDQMPTPRMDDKQTHGEMPKGEMEPKRSNGNAPSFDMNSASTQGEMPSFSMDSAPIDGTMPGGEMSANEPEGGLQRVLVEMRVSKTQGITSTLQLADRINVSSFQLDSSFAPIPMNPTDEHASLISAADEDVVIVRGTIDVSQIQELEAQPNVLKVYLDTPIAPFPSAVLEEEQTTPAMLLEPMATCPIGTCDCAPGTAKGAIADVAQYLGVDQIWAAGSKGDSIVIGIVDGGITAVGRTVKPGEEATPKVPRVIGGWPTADWGTTGKAWSNHGNMTATDALGMAPQAQIYDIRISDGDAISTALAGFQWAIDQHKTNGTPHILSNSWGMFQESWDKVYARDPNHPFTRKVVEAINEGILVLFAAGNCGATCPDGRCGPDSGPGRSIWGANGHPLVMTVGAVNKNEQFVGYSSQGPAALDPQKPDFCSITHFKGYFGSDNGTSAATPIAAGVVALLKQGNPALTQDQAKNALKSTAKDIGPTGWDQHSGAGIIQAKAAYDAVLPHWSGWQNLGGFCTYGVTAASWAANRLDTFVIGGDSAMYHKWWDGSAWSAWENLGGYCVSAPAAVSWGPNRIDTFVIGGDGALYHKWWDGSAWSGWDNLGGYCTYGVTAASPSANRLDVFVIGGDSAMYHKWWDGSTWSGWENLGGFCISAPAAVSWGPNRIDTFVIGGDRAMYHKWWDGSTWSGWDNLGGFCNYGVTAASPSTNRLDTFVIGGDRAMYHKWWNGSAWSGWEYLGGFCISAPGAVSWGPNRIDTFVLGGDRAMYHKWWS